MIFEGQGNLLRAHAEALVNTVNTVGVMGKGVALQFKQAFPDNFRAYEVACKRHEVRLGRMFVWQTDMLFPRFIVNFPTKGHWRGNAKLGDIEAGLRDLVRIVREEQIQSIAIPPLGCGLGGLRWEEVRPLIERAFNEMPEVHVFLFAPAGAIDPKERVVRTARPNMTAWRAALVKIVQSYSVLGYEATHIEAQKLLYFLVRAGEPLRVSFQKGNYGPYDPNMRHALQAMEGHYVTGFGDGGVLESVRLVEGAAEEAALYLQDSMDGGATMQRIERVSTLIEGFETPYGLELLATVDWVVDREGASTVDEAVSGAKSWNGRKAKVLEERHLRIAYQRLSELGWIRYTGC